MRIIARVALAAVLGSGGIASAQQASEAVKAECRKASRDVARLYMNAKKKGVRDLERGVRKPSSEWGEQVANYMAQAVSRSETLTESELATLGYSYCVERRPVQ